MPRHDMYHDVVKRALEKDGWHITHDPFTLTFGVHRLFVDLGAERMLAAEKGERRIAVEIKSFLNVSPIEDLQQALGQYVLYRSVLMRSEPERQLYLAVPARVYQELLMTSLGQIVIEDYTLSVLLFDPVTEEVQQWMS